MWMQYICVYVSIYICVCINICIYYKLMSGSTSKSLISAAISHELIILVFYSVFSIYLSLSDFVPGLTLKTINP